MPIMPKIIMVIKLKINKLILLLFCSLLMLSACSKEEPLKHSFFAMDTIIDFTVYGQDQELIKQMEAKISELDQQLSVTNPDSQLTMLNNDGQAEFSPEVAALFSEALQICEQTNGAMDISIYPLIEAWGFISGHYQVPTDQQLAAILPLVDYNLIEQQDNIISLQPGMKLDLGSVAKGYAGDILIKMMADAGLESAIINLGGNVQTLGLNPEGEPWQIGIQDPDLDGYVGIIEAQNQAVITSGGYQRFFSDEYGHIYSHILDPFSGKPVQNGILSVTVVCDKGLRADALSTALFVMGLEQATEFWHKEGGFEAVFVGADDQVYITAGLKDRFTLVDEQQKWQLTVIE